VLASPVPSFSLLPAACSVSMGVKLEAILKIACLWLVAYPMCSALVSVVVAGPIAAIEGTAFDTAWLFSLTVMTLTGIPVTTWAPVGTGGIVITIVVGVLQMGLTIVFVGITAGPMIDPFVDYFGLGDTRTVMKKLAIFCLVAYPLAAILCALVLGGILAAAEGWPFSSGFVLALGELTATGVTSGPSVPQTNGGAAVGLLVGTLAMMFLGVIIAVGSVPLLGFGLTFDQAPLFKKLPFLLNSEQKKSMLVRVDAQSKQPKTPSVVPAG
jgi:hypothetical protein